MEPAWVLRVLELSKEDWVEQEKMRPGEEVYGKQRD